MSLGQGANDWHTHHDLLLVGWRENNFMMKDTCMIMRSPQMRGVLDEPNAVIGCVGVLSPIPNKVGPELHHPSA
jgi:hypothetical protein